MSEELKYSLTTSLMLVLIALVVSAGVVAGCAISARIATTAEVKGVTPAIKIDTVIGSIEAESSAELID